MNREGTPEALVYADQKTKKRNQNRVAQRTYRNRLKQRVQDLEQQLCEMRARQQQQQQQHFPQYMAGNVISDGSTCFVSSASNMPCALWQQHTPRPGTPGSLRQDVSPGMAVNGTTEAIADSVSMATNTYVTRDFTQKAHYNNPFFLNQIHPAAAGLDHVRNGMMSPGQEMASQPPMQRLHSHGSAGLTSNQDLMQQNAHFGYRVAVNGLAFEVSDKEGFTSPTSWENSPAMMTLTSSITGTVAPQSTISTSIATTATEVSDAASPHQFSSIEERFAYVLQCARRVGFDTFDSIAAQYYATSFDPCSSVAMDQRLSRNRHLPALLSEIQQKSAHWSVWERSAYQDEVLRTVEDICAIECREFSTAQDLNDVNTLNLATIQQKLPNVWTLLSGLASATSRQDDRSNLVYSSIKQLCALGDASDDRAVNN